MIKNGVAPKDGTGKGRWDHAFLWFEIIKGEQIGEDVSFCHKWRALGGKIFIDPTIQTGHQMKRYNVGTLSDYLRAQPAEITCLDQMTGKW